MDAKLSPHPTSSFVRNLLIGYGKARSRSTISTAGRRALQVGRAAVGVHEMRLDGEACAPHLPAVIKAVLPVPRAGTFSFRDTSTTWNPATIGEGTGIVSFGPDVVARITSVCGIGEVAFTTMTILFGPAA